MKHLKNIIKLFSKDLPKPLGRWRIEYCNKKINNKIDLSNEDHCGPCGQYLLKKEFNPSIDIYLEKQKNNKK